MNPDLLILCATLPEISGFLSGYRPDSRRITRTGQPLFSGRVHDKGYELIITGPGVFNAAQALTAYLEQSSCALIVQTGIAGVFKGAGLDIGDVAVATEEHYFHTGIATKSIVNAPLPFDLIDSLPLTREGRYPFDPDQVEACYENLFQGFSDKGVRVVKGPFMTVSAITATFRQADLIYAAFSPVMEAMEGAASAHIAARYKIPMIEVRAASNFVGERDKLKWNMDKAAEHLKMACALIP